MYTGRIETVTELYGSIWKLPIFLDDILTGNCSIYPSGKRSVSVASRILSKYELTVLSIVGKMTKSTFAE